VILCPSDRSVNQGISGLGSDERDSMGPGVPFPGWNPGNLGDRLPERRDETGRVHLLFAVLTLTIQLQRSSLDLLDGVGIEVAAHNGSGAPVTVRFAGPAEYEIDVLREGRVIWHSSNLQPPGITFPIHTRTFLPGPTVLVIYAWNDLTEDGFVPAPGSYTIVARMLGQGVRPQAQTRLEFVAPLSISALAQIKEGVPVTVWGRLDPAKPLLTDDTGSTKLSRRPSASNGASFVAIRGYVTLAPDRSRLLTVTRWAPLLPSAK
jgi:hypothetical protein